MERYVERYMEQSPGQYRGKQSDKDFQRHEAERRRREGAGQDRFGQSRKSSNAMKSTIAEGPNEIIQPARVANDERVEFGARTYCKAI